MVTERSALSQEGSEVHGRLSPMKYQKRGSVPSSSFSRKTGLFASTQRISESGSSRLPKTRAPVGQASAQAGSRPCRVRWMQKVHFSTHPFLRARFPR